MRMPHVLTLIGAAALSSAAFAAPGSVTPDAGSTAMASVAVVGSAYKLRPFEFDGVQGVYALSDGRLLRVSGEQRKLYAAIGNGRSEMVPVAQNVFVAPGDGLKLTFDQIPFATAVSVTPANAD
jgi:hypothetical protein